MSVEISIISSAETKETEFWARTRTAVVLLDTDRFGDVLNSQKIKKAWEDGLPIRTAVDGHIEKILPSGSEVLLMRGNRPGIFEVLECEYTPYANGKKLFAVAQGNHLETDVKFSSILPRRFPDAASILRNLESLNGIPYLHGGSCAEPSMAWNTVLRSLKLVKGVFRNQYPEEYKRLVTAYGVDCSGILNIATNYAFFGDSKDIIDFVSRREGKLVKIEGLRAREIVALLKPLDVTVFKDHMMIYLGNNRVIQAVGVGENADAFVNSTGFSGKPEDKYNQVVIDNAEQILNALVVGLGKSPSSEWQYADSKKFMVVNWWRGK